MARIPACLMSAGGGIEANPNILAVKLLVNTVYSSVDSRQFIWYLPTTVYAPVNVSALEVKPSCFARLLFFWSPNGIYAEGWLQPTNSRIQREGAGAATYGSCCRTL